MARTRIRPGYDHRHNTLHVLGGIALMLGSVAVTLAILTQYAGAWGVPYFSFTTDRGSTCTNDLTGYTCEAMTLADIEYFGDIDLPDDSSVVAGTYRVDPRLPDGSSDRRAWGVSRPSTDQPQRGVRQLHLRPSRSGEHRGHAGHVRNGQRRYLQRLRTSRAAGST